MNLSKLFESAVLTDETKQVLQEAWNAAMEEEKSRIEAEYAEKLNEARSTLNETAMNVIEAAISEQMDAVAEELAEARTIEFKYAGLLENFKAQYAEKMDEQIKELVAESVAEVTAELKEEIEYAKKHRFGQSLYEAFRDAYIENFGDDSQELKKTYESAIEELNTLRREKILNSLLESVEGEKKAVVKTILESVATDKLEAKFESLRPIILSESEKNEESVKLKEEQTKEGVLVLESVNPAKEDTKKETDIDEVSARLFRSLSRFVK